MESFKNILLVSATEQEIAPLLLKLNQPVYSNSFIREYYLSQNTNLDVIITGVGSPFTIYKMMRMFSRIKYTLVINVGIAGTYKHETPIGSIVNVRSEQFADLGIDETQGFQTIFEKKLADPNQLPFTEGKLINPHVDSFPFLNSLPQVDGITVNTAHANSSSIEVFRTKFSPDVESMEGAAVFFLSLQEKTPFVEIRAISNLVKPREEAQWDITKAIDNLNTFIYDFLKELNVD